MRLCEKRRKRFLGGAGSLGTSLDLDASNLSGDALFTFPIVSD